jgi:ATP-dependent Clp protease ATP-binding subunit ClpA
VVFGKRVPMFERYTENARRTIFFGRSEAIERGSAFIESDHILLALLRDAWLTGNLLNDISAAALRDEFPAFKGEESSAAPDVPLSNESKRVLSHAAEEADVLFDSHIGNEHLLLGLLREKSCSAARMLTEEDWGWKACGAALRVSRAKLEKRIAESRACDGVPLVFLRDMPGRGCSTTRPVKPS